MTLVKLKTKYGMFHLVVENVNSPEMKELYYRPYVEAVYIEAMSHYLEDEQKELMNTSSDVRRLLELK